MSSTLPRATSLADIKAIPLETMELDVIPWGCSIVIQKLTAGAVEKIMGPVKEGDRVASMIAQRKVFIESVIEPRVDPGEFDNLARLDANAMMIVYEAIAKFNGLDAATTEVLTKN